MDEATGRWVTAGETDGPQTSLAVDGLTPGHKYKFRVRAVNRWVFFSFHYFYIYQLRYTMARFEYQLSKRLNKLYEQVSQS